MLDREWAIEFAHEWIEAWNAHDLERILAHYADDVRMSSPLVVARTGRPDGVVRGKAALAQYWRPGLEQQPPLRFELLDVLVGVDRLTLYYRSVGRRIVAETLIFDADLLAVEGCAQWSALQRDGE